MKINIAAAIAATLAATAAMAQMASPEPAAPVPGETTHSMDTKPPATATAPDGVWLDAGKWVKDGRPATKAEIAAHKQWMSQNGQSTTGTPDK